MTARLASKVVVVTGGSSGIGRAVAERVASEGAAVVLGARRADAGEQVVLNQVLVRFLAPDGDHDAHTRRVVERVQRDGTCWMSGTTWHGQAAMRISVSNWSADEADVDRSVAATLRCARPAVPTARDAG